MITIAIAIVIILILFKTIPALKSIELDTFIALFIDRYNRINLPSLLKESVDIKFTSLKNFRIGRILSNA